MKSKVDEINKGNNEALEVLKQYLEAWKKGDFKLMFDKSQKTYKAVHRDTKEAHIIEFVGSKKLTSYKIGDPVRVGEAMKDIPVEIYYQQKKEKFHKNIKVRLAQEISAYQASVTGTWGVNPISTFKEEEIKPKKKEVKK